MCKRDVKDTEVGNMNVLLTTGTFMRDDFDLMPKKKKKETQKHSRYLWTQCLSGCLRESFSSNGRNDGTRNHGKQRHMPT